VLREALAAFGAFSLAKKNKIEAAAEWHVDHPGTLSRETVGAYADNLRKGVSRVFGPVDPGGRYFEIGVKAQANVTRFAAHKTAWLQKTVDAATHDQNGNPLTREGRLEAATAILHTANRYQVAEYNTAVTRARTARQWQNFNTPQSREMYPNLRWIASRSATPREEHRRYWGIILPKDDPFWRTEQPGNLWNCKCDWEETSLPATGLPDDVPRVPPARGLESNPGVDGEIFTRQASYYQGVNEAMTRQIGGVVRNMMLREALGTLRDVRVAKETDDGEIEVSFNRKGLEHVQSDYFPDTMLRDMLLPKMDKILAKAQYLATAPDDKGNAMIVKYHYYEIELFGKSYLLNVREQRDGKAYLYAITKKRQE
jgi:hypothetical protein